MGEVTRVPRARLYHSVRTAHLERAHALAPAPILYCERRYDFDSELAQGLELIPAGRFAAARWLWKNRPDVLEINEPLMIEAALWTAISVAILDLRNLTRTRVVTYAIENRDPLQDARPARWRSRLKSAMRVAAVRMLSRRVDRICYGTSAARDLYHDTVKPTADEAVIWALPNAQVTGDTSREPRVVFVSSFAERKGVQVLLQSWPHVVESFPEATLVMIGKGALQADVEQAALHDPSITVHVDPPRTQIYHQLSNAQVVVLPSLATPTWREQVGLPIVEGLSYGCTIVTTSETGLSDWLSSHGHHVIEPGNAGALSTELIRALRNPVPASDVVDSLPAEDGRLAADRWMFRP